MAAKTKYVCQSCGFISPKWLGRCTDCGEWNSLAEETVQASTPAASRTSSMAESEVIQLDADLEDSVRVANQPRTSTCIGELDRVLGGGLLRGSFILLGGEPGIGKSTILLQMADGFVSASEKNKILYVSGEESVEQIQDRSKRLGIENANRILLHSATRLESALEQARKHQPQLLIMDSLQTFASDELQSAPGSVSQVREIAARLMTFAKSTGTIVWLVGHVTKEGSIAGPKVVEHMVDTVLYFEGDQGESYRLLRSVKNRFGSARELGVFEMEASGLREVSNPSEIFLNERKTSVPGTSICACMEGSRPILIELQALVSDSPLALPRRTSVGVDQNRMALIAAILERHMGLVLANQDLYFNVAGGLKLAEPGFDLAAAAAIWSSAMNRALPLDLVWIGEVGLTGEVRKVSQLETRLEEAAKLGFKQAVVPASSLQRLKDFESLTLLGVEKIQEIEKFVDS